MRPPSGNVTFLFTDIEGSTQLWERHGEAMGHALAQHDALLRATSEEHRGYVFKTVGDAFCVAFSGALDAVRAAAAAQRSLATAAWGGTGPLRVRMALHSGGAEEREGDYFGPTLNRVARLLAAGHGGQMLLSLVTAEIVREQLPHDMSLRDLGERRLKDLSRPERVFQLVTADLPGDFPPLRSLEVFPNNLPAQVTSFVGRANELAEAKRLIGTTRLLTLTGPGGTGKTRLSLQAAAEILDRFPHGVWLVELATLSDPGRLPETIANVVDVREEHGRLLVETLVESLRARHVLLLLDNCEHLIAACARTASTLLQRCPGVKVLATSREALNIQGETIQPLAPLPVLEFGADAPSLETDRLAQLEAVQLFVERAAAVRPNFALTSSNAGLIARICWRLDGIPLAIELAAARIKVLPLEQILARLDDRFGLLSGGSRTALPRQQTLGALIDWSYDLLSDPERILLRRLSVFVAGRTLEMAEVVCGGDGLDRRSVFDLLSALVEKSLLTLEPGPDGESRYTMLESVWDYADDKLAQAQETERYRRQHLEFFVRLGEEAEPSLFGSRQKAWLEKLSAEHYNLNTALRFSGEHPNTIELGLRLAGAVARYWEVRSYLSEGYEHLHNLLSKAERTSAGVRAKAELGAGRLLWAQDRAADAVQHYRRAQEFYRGSDHREMDGMIEAMLGFAQRDEAHHDQALAHFERAKAIGAQYAIPRVQSMALNGIGALAGDHGDFVTARASKEQSLAIVRHLGDLWVVALMTASLGRLCFAAGDDATARAYLAESLQLGRELGNKWVAPYALEALANVLARAGQGEKAARLYGAAAASREALALAFSPAERSTYEAALSRLRRLVPDAAFERAWHAGRTLALPAAVDLALELDSAPLGAQAHTS
ncbi:MAG: adenylate/guanylate cyclase domain-containing protein [Verrucomicrobiota bacterium]